MVLSVMSANLPIQICTGLFAAVEITLELLRVSTSLPFRKAIFGPGPTLT